MRTHREPCVIGRTVIANGAVGRADVALLPRNDGRSLSRREISFVPSDRDDVSGRAMPVAYVIDNGLFLMTDGGGRAELR